MLACCCGGFLLGRIYKNELQNIIRPFANDADFEVLPARVEKCLKGASRDESGDSAIDMKWGLLSIAPITGAIISFCSLLEQGAYAVYNLALAVFEQQELASGRESEWKLNINESNELPSCVYDGKEYKIHRLRTGSNTEEKLINSLTVLFQGAKERGELCHKTTRIRVIFKDTSLKVTENWQKEKEEFETEYTKTISLDTQNYKIESAKIFSDKELQAMFVLAQSDSAGKKSFDIAIERKEGLSRMEKAKAFGVLCLADTVNVCTLGFFKFSLFVPTIRVSF